MKTVLAPIDFSRISKRVIDEAIVIARAIDGRLVLLTIVQPPAIIASEFAPTEFATGFSLQAEKDATERLAELQKYLRDNGVTAHAIHQVGQPGARIVEQAERLDADYIVMGSHGHGAFYELIAGSTTTRVLKQAACPVVIVPAGIKKPRKANGVVAPQRDAVEVQGWSRLPRSAAGNRRWRNGNSCGATTPQKE